jgi:transcriptional regulator with XRE-family HTH domain
MASPFSRFLLDKMAEKNWNPSQLANAVGVHRGTVGRWIKEGLLPSFETMKKIAKGLGVPLQVVIDAVEGRYDSLSDYEREAVEITRRYAKESIKLAYEQQMALH